MLILLIINSLNFLPLALLNQFMDYFNLFFLFCTILYSIEIISPVEPSTTYGPFLIVLGIGLIKKGIENYKKYKYDEKYNNSLSYVYDNKSKKFVQTLWKDIEIGDIIKVEKDSEIPADLLIIKTGEEHGYCYLKTSNLDGETNLKRRDAIPILQKYIYEDKNFDIQGKIFIDYPNKNIYSINGSIKFEKDTLERINNYLENNNDKNEKNKNSLNNNNNDINNNLNSNNNDNNENNKNSLNSNNNDINNNLNSNYNDLNSNLNNIKKNKNSSNIELLISKNNNFNSNNNNNDDIIIFDYEKCLIRGGILKNVSYVYGIVIYTGSQTKLMLNIKKTSMKKSGLDLFLAKIVKFLIVISLIMTIIMSIIGITKSDKNHPNKSNIKMEYVYYKFTRGNKILEAVRTVVAFWNTFCSLIPISLKISLEVCKVIQTFIVSFEDGYGEEGEKKNFLSLNLHENLGSIRYIFSDKTGTLTKNEMQFKGCSIFTNLYFQGTENTNTYYIRDIDATTTKTKTLFSKKFNPFLLIESFKKKEQINFQSINSEECYLKTKGETTCEFFTNIALNHNVLVNEEFVKNINNSNNDNKNKIQFDNNYHNKNGENDDDMSEQSYYSGSNPDEVVLVHVARELGIEFVSNIMDTITLKVRNETKTFTCLYKFEFSSERKRSSIIVRDNSNNQIKLFMKGADSIIFQKISDFSKNNLLTQTSEHVDKFAKEGLRTLCYTSKIISEEEFKVFNSKYIELKEKSKSKELEELISEMENNSLLLGASALEDMLQDKVKPTIKDLMDAGINVWMLTGDKLDTAETIGYACKLLSDDTEVYKIQESDKKNLFQKLKGIKKKQKTLLIKKASFVKKESMNNNDNAIKKNDIYNNNRNNLNEEKGNLYLANNNIVINDTKFFSNPEVRDNILNQEIHNIGTHIKVYSQNNDNYNSNQNIKNSEKINSKNDVEFLMNNNSKKINSKNHVEFLMSNNSKKINNKKDTILSNQEDIPGDKTIINYLRKENFFEEDDEGEHEQSINISFCNESINHLDSNERNKKENNFAEYKKKLKTKLKQEKELKEDSNENNIQLRNNSLIIEGSVLDECLIGENANILYEILSNCRSVICARCAPLQKSKVVDFIKSRSGEMTLAIGDGGNDVNMIQAADVGVGLFGKEGSQAAFSSDYAFSQFKYIRKLLFTHGRYSILRNSYFVNYYFFKNVIYTFIEFWFSLYSFASGSILFDSFYIFGFNSFLSTVPPMVYAVFNEDIDISFKKNDKKINERLLSPLLYKITRDSKPFNIFHFIQSFILGFIMSLICFFIPKIALGEHNLNNNGNSSYLADLCFCTFWNLVISSFVVLLLNSNYYNVWVSGLHILQLLIIIAFPYCNTNDKNIVGTRYLDSFKNVTCLFILFCGIMYNLLVFAIYKTILKDFSDNIITRVKYGKISDDISNKKYWQKMTKIERIDRSLKKFKFLFQCSNYDNNVGYVDRKMQDIVLKFKKERENNNYEHINVNNDNINIIDNNINNNDNNVISS